jgi:alpha-N-arabinofuranosidase
MRAKHSLFGVLLLAGALTSAYAQSTADRASLIVHTDQTGPVIHREIFGQFAEQLGHGIYGGVWVGKNSKIPNVRGIRSDVVGALRALKIPDVRWPGGCYAEAYHWRNGIGPAAQRKTTLNTSWGGALESNAFGTDEFMDFIDQIGSEAYITVNVATGSPQEAADWLEYMTADQPTTLAKERAANGHKAPYRVKYLGIGNESWGCGGAMTPDAYVDRMKIYSMFVHNLNPAQSGTSRFMPGPDPMIRIAVGPPDDETAYTEAVMQAWQHTTPWSWGIEGLSYHHYTAGEKGAMRDPAVGFGEKEYATFVKNTYAMDGLIAKQTAIMDKYDPQKKVALVVDEWGTWLQPTPGTPMLFLQQQNSLRDAIVASLHLNIFARHADRVRMANIAQMVNVLQAMILTRDEKMLLTPTYHVFKMYVPFQDAKFIPVNIDAGTYKYGDVALPRVDAIAARAKDGKIWLALTNIDPNTAVDIAPNLAGGSVTSATGEVLTAPQVDSINTFEQPDAVTPKPVSAQMQDGALLLHLPPKSITVVQLEQ